MISAEAISKRFGTHTAVDAVSFTIAPGEIVGFLGPNGAGKTTTLRMLAGVFPPSSGRARVGGEDAAFSRRARTRVGYMPERAALYTEMTVAAQLRFVAALRGGRGGAAARRAVGAVLERTRLGPLAARRIETLSKGQRQRVALATALVADPPALLLDEPTAGLDPAERNEARALVRAVAPGRAVLLSSHLLDDVATLCDRVVILHRGRVVAAARPAELAHRVSAHVQVALAARAPAGALRAALERVPGVRRVEATDGADGVVTCRIRHAPDADVRGALAAAVVAGGWELLGLERVEPSLETIFLDLLDDGAAGA